MSILSDRDRLRVTSIRSTFICVPDRNAKCAVSPAALFLGAVAALACAESPNLLLVSIDTLRSDHTSAYGYDRDTTPRLAQLAAAGVRFELAYAASASTGPSHATLFTGSYPLYHGLVKNGLPLVEDRTTLAEILRDEDYVTAGVAASFVLDPRFGFAQGFELYDADFKDASVAPQFEWEGHVVPIFDRIARETTQTAIRWLRAKRDSSRPFFLFVHYFDPHSPYGAPGAGRFEPSNASRLERDRALYDGEVAYVDEQLGLLLDVLESEGLSAKTLVVVTGDHGEGLGDHGFMLHAVNLYEEAVRVPLVMRMPGVIPAGHTLRGPVEAVDVLPTILGLLGVRHRSGALHGRNLAPAAEGDATLASDHPVYLLRRHYAASLPAGIPALGMKIAVREGRWKLIRDEGLGIDELYDLEADPEESRNRLEAEPVVASYLGVRLAEWRRRFDRLDEIPPLDPGDVDALRALGYLE